MAPVGRRRGRRRGLIVGAAVGSAAARRRDAEYESGGQEYSAPVQEDKYAQLEQLARMHEQGILSDGEFQAEKEKLLK